MNHDSSCSNDYRSVGVSAGIDFDGTNLRVVIPMYEEVKRMLQSYQYCLWRINQNKEMIEKLRALAEKTSPSYSLAPGGDTKDSMANAAAKIVDLEREIAEDSARLKDELMLVDFLIGSLDDFQQRQVIELRYKHGYPWRKIQRELPYGRTQIFRLHMWALDKLLPLVQKLGLNGT